jgi:hypothetical protein
LLPALLLLLISRLSVGSDVGPTQAAAPANGVLLLLRRLVLLVLVLVVLLLVLVLLLLLLEVGSADPLLAASPTRILAGAAPQLHLE